MSPVAVIIDKFGGTSALARLLGHDYPTTVQGWKTRGIIPARQQAKVLDAARSAGIPLTPADFFAASDDTACAECSGEGAKGEGGPI